MKNQGEKQTRKQQTTKCQTWKAPTFWTGVFWGHFYCIIAERLCPSGGILSTGDASESAVSNTELSPLSVLYVYVPKRTHRVSRRTHTKSVSLQSSVSSLLRTSGLETVFHSFPRFSLQAFKDQGLSAPSVAISLCDCDFLTQGKNHSDSWAPKASHLSETARRQ